MKKFIIFAYNAYDAKGGMKDIIGQEDLLSEAIKLAKNKEFYDYVNIINRDNWKIAWENRLT